MPPAPPQPIRRMICNPPRQFPSSVVDAFQIVDNYLIANKINDCGISHILARLRGPDLDVYRAPHGCPPAGLIIIINRGYYFPATRATLPIRELYRAASGRRATAVIGTCVSIQYAYEWRFGRVASLLGATSISAQCDYRRCCRHERELKNSYEAAGNSKIFAHSPQPPPTNVASPWCWSRWRWSPSLPWQPCRSMSSRSIWRARRRNDTADAAALAAARVISLLRPDRRSQQLRLFLAGDLRLERQVLLRKLPIAVATRGAVGGAAVTTPSVIVLGRSDAPALRTAQPCRLPAPSALTRWLPCNSTGQVCLLFSRASGETPETA